MKNTKSQSLDDSNLDWALLFQAFMDSFEWALDVAAGFARDYPQEVAAVERVRVFMRKHVAGQTAHVRIDDLLFAFGLVVGAIERDLSPGNRPQLSFGTPVAPPERALEMAEDPPFAMAEGTQPGLAPIATRDRLAPRAAAAKLRDAMSRAA